MIIWYRIVGYANGTHINLRDIEDVKIIRFGEGLHNIVKKMNSIMNIFEISGLINNVIVCPHLTKNTGKNKLGMNRIW